MVAIAGTSKELADSLDAAVDHSDRYVNHLLRIVTTRCMTQALPLLSAAVVHCTLYVACRAWHVVCCMLHDAGRAPFPRSQWALRDTLACSGSLQCLCCHRPPISHSAPLWVPDARASGQFDIDLPPPGDSLPR